MTKPVSCIIFSAAKVLDRPSEIEERRADIRSLLWLYGYKEPTVQNVLSSAFRTNPDLLRRSVSVLETLMEYDCCCILHSAEDLFVDGNEAFLAPELMRFAAHQMAGLEHLARSH